MNTDKKVGFKQRVPVEVFAECLREYVQRKQIAPARVVELLSGYFTGEHARYRSMLHITACLNNSTIMPILFDRSDEISTAIGNQREAYAFCFALLCARYSLCYDIAVELSKLFRLQDVVPKDLIAKRIGDKYAFNENVKRAMERFLAFCEDAKFIIRIEKSSYELAERHGPISDALIALWICVYNLNEPLGVADDIAELQFEPFFRYLCLG